LLGGWIAIQWLASQLLVNPLVTAGQDDLFRPFVVTTALSLVVVVPGSRPHAGRRAAPGDSRPLAAATAGGGGRYMRWRLRAVELLVVAVALQPHLAFATDCQEITGLPGP